MSVESVESFAHRCAHWLGTIAPTIELMPDLPASAPGAIICSFRGGAAMLFATGYPAIAEDGSETYSEAILFVDLDRLGLAGLGALSAAWRRAGIVGSEPWSVLM